MPCPLSLQSDPLLVHATCATAAPRPPDSWPASHPALYALLSTRQFANSFDQPLSLDTSSVTDMSYMVSVRSARALAPSLRPGPPRAHHLRRRSPTASRLLARISRPASYALLLTRQGASAFNQPLSLDTSSVTAMDGMFYVRSARALAPSLRSGPLPVHAACDAAAPFPRALPACTSPRIVRPPSNLAERVGVQPAAELRHVQGHNHGRHV